MHNDSGNYNFNLHRSVILLILPFDAANENKNFMSNIVQNNEETFQHKKEMFKNVM